ncbi:MAG: acyltransferase family protein [Culicoidibacterales bacterium]
MLTSLQGLRVLATLAIFLFHSGLLLKGTFPVTFFFILSGFVGYYAYHERFQTYTVKETRQWLVNRWLVFIPVHFVTFLMSIIIRWNWVISQPVNELATKAVLNLSLIQTAVTPHFAFNGASWYLSTLMCIYVVTVPLIRAIKKISQQQAMLVIAVVFTLQVIVNVVPYELNLYASPYYRVFDFALGALCAKVFIETNEIVKPKSWYTRMEVLTIIIFFITYITTFMFETNLTYYTPIFLMALYVFACGQGMISQILAQPIFQKIAMFSFEFYLVHELVLIVFRRVFPEGTTYWLIRNIQIAIPSFVISLALAWLLNRYVSQKVQRILKNKKRK